MLLLVLWISGTWSFTENWGEYYALILWSTVGMMLLTASDELVTLFLTLETMTICLYLATAFEKDKRRSAEGGLKYFVYGSVSSALFLFGLSLVYGLTGSTRFHAIHQALNPPAGLHQGLAGNVVGAASVLLMLVGFGFKIAAVPFHQWAPDAYEGAPAPVTAWVATGSKVASFVAMMKVMLFALGPWASGSRSVMSPGWIGVVAALSAASMTYGNFAALAQRNYKRMLAYSSVAHAGYMLVGVVAAGVSVRQAQAAGAVLYYLVIYAIGNLGAFAVAAWLARDKGSDEIEDLNGLARSYPGLATCLLLLMLSLIGMPPMAGFFGKLYMFMEVLDESVPGRITLMWLVALGLMNSVVSAFYYVRVIKAMFLRAPGGPELKPPPTSVLATVVLATAVTLGFGLFPSPLVETLRPAAIHMLAENPSFGEIASDGTPGSAPTEAPRPSTTPPAPAPVAK
jgi:NADH-quinone oxidoreductase subunit N